MRNPKNVRVFLAIVRSGSIGQAAQLLSRGQSAVSRSIHELEVELGAVLFERHSHGMQLTGFGNILRPRAEAAFAEMEGADAAFATQLPPGGWVRTAPIFTLALTLQRLRVLTEMAEYHSMVAVAQALGLSQSAVSQCIAQIELSVGVTLFTRTGSRTTPTRLGTMLASHTRRALAELRMGADEVADAMGNAHGQVTVGSLSLGRAELLPRAIAQLLEQFPHVVVRTQEGSYDHLAWLLREGEIDFILGALRPPESTGRFSREVLRTDRLMVLARTTHPLAAQSAATVDDLSNRSWVLPGHGAPTRELLETALRSRNIDPPRVSVETTDLTIMLGLLMETDLITAASPALFHRELAANLITSLPIEFAETTQPIGLYWRTGTVPSTAAGHLMNLLRSIGKCQV